MRNPLAPRRPRRATARAPGAARGNRSSAYTTPSAARSSAASRATRCSAGSVCITASVCSNVARYWRMSRVSAPRVEPCGGSCGSVAEGLCIRSRQRARRSSRAAARRRGDRGAAPSAPPAPLRASGARASADDVEDGTCARRLGPMSIAPSRASTALRTRSGSSTWLEDGLRSTASPSLATQSTPAVALTGSSLRDRPAPGRHAAMPTLSASSRVM